MLQPGQVLFGKYRVIEKLGAGGFAEVYRAKSIIEKKYIAVKVEKDGPQVYRTLEHEAITLNKLKDLPGVPKVLFMKSVQGKHMMGLKMLDEDLYSLRKRGVLHPSHENLILIGWKLLNILEAVHNAGVLHMDIKPDNVMLSKKKKDMYLIDFGLAKDWQRTCGGSMFMGSLLFCSARRMEKRPPARKDDIESWLYSLMHLAAWHLPWALSIHNKELGWKSEVAEMKRNLNVGDMVKDLPREFTEITNYIRAMQPIDRPSYEIIRNLLKQAASRLNVNLESQIQLRKDDPEMIETSADMKVEEQSHPKATYSKHALSVLLSTGQKRLNRSHSSTAILRNHKEEVSGLPAEESDISTPKGLNLEFSPVVTNGLRSHLRLRRMSACD